MDFFNDHKKLFVTALGMFVFLTIMVAILPAINNQRINKPLPNAVPLSKEANLGKMIYMANGCVACHTQQVRNIDEDKVWGNRPSIAADYAGNTRTDFWRNTATLMGTERTGPDLTNIGNRQSSQAWNLLHLYQPRAVVEKSIMPAYPWLFEIKKEAAKTDVEVNVPEAFRNGIEGKIVATKDALNLVAYLQSLKQTPLPTGLTPVKFLYPKATKTVAKDSASATALPDGKNLYVTICQACHQPNGEGLPGAFPPLKGSEVVNGDNLELYVTIIMQGYNGKTGFGEMPAIGTINNFTAEDVTALINHEKTSWGNKAKTVTLEEVKKIYDVIKATNKP